MAKQKIYGVENTSNVMLRLGLKNAALFEARKKLGITLKQAAEKIGLAYGTLAHIESLVYFPSVECQKKICDYYRGEGVFLFEDEVFPEKLKSFEKKKRVSEKEKPTLITLLSAAPLLPAYNEDFEGIEKRVDSPILMGLINKAVHDCLNFNQEKALRLRHGFYDNTSEIRDARNKYGIEDGEMMSHRKIGEHLKLSKGRAQQLVTLAEEKLRVKLKRLSSDSEEYAALLDAFNLEKEINLEDFIVQGKLGCSVPDKFRRYYY